VRPGLGAGAVAQRRVLNGAGDQGIFYELLAFSVNCL
jgi:hypothetical protein